MKSLIRLRALSIVVVKVPAFLVLFFSLAQAQQPAWRLAAGTQGILVSDIDVFPSNPDTVYANGEFGLMLSTDRGEHWDTVSTTERSFGGALKVDRFNSQIVWAWRVFPFGDALGFTTDGGHTWRFVSQSRNAATIVEFDPVDLSTVYSGVGSSFIHRTTDYGLTWELLPSPSGDLLTSLAISPINNNVLYLGYVSGLYKSTDRGLTWIQLPLDVYSAVKVTVDPSNVNIVYAGMQSLGVHGAYKSTDGGASWMEKNNGLDSLRGWGAIQCIAINPKNPKELFLGTGTEHGRMLFRSTNGADRWEVFGNGLPDSGSACGITIDTSGNRIYVSARGVNVTRRGIYVLDMLTGLIDNKETEHPHGFVLHQNYPNPFNSQTAIEFFLPHKTSVAIRVYSILGQELTTLLVNEQEAGNHRVVFDAENLPSGVYYYRLNTPTFSQSKPMLLLK